MPSPIGSIGDPNTIGNFVYYFVMMWVILGIGAKAASMFGGSGRERRTGGGW